MKLYQVFEKIANWFLYSFFVIMIAGMSIGSCILVSYMRNIEALPVIWVVFIMSSLVKLSFVFFSIALFCLAMSILFIPNDLENNHDLNKKLENK